MKHILILLIAYSMITPLLICQELTGEEIMNSVNEIFNPETSRGISTMTITTSSGNERTFKFESWAKGKGEKNLVRYLEPSRVKNQAVLMLNDADDIWAYFPRTNRVRKLATHAKKQKFEGSDFSYEDMGGGDAFLTDYSSKRLADEEIQDYDCYMVELIKKPDSDMSYYRIIMWIIKDNFCPVYIEYYEEDKPDRLQKTLTQYDIKMIDGMPVAMNAVMKNINDNTETKTSVIDVEFNVEIDDEMFTERSLKR